MPAAEIPFSISFSSFLPLNNAHSFSSVFKAVNILEHRVAACKFIALTEQTTETERKTVEKEMRVHAALKHEHVLEFLNAVVVDLKHKQTYIPGIYMLLEFAGGGDLFDKIGMLSINKSMTFFSPGGNSS